MKVEALFDFKTGNLPALENTDSGNVPLIYGTSFNNGVVKFVEVETESDIFQPPLITVSYLGTSFVQITPFTTSVVDKSNIIILAPKKKMVLNVSTPPFPSYTSRFLSINCGSRYLTLEVLVSFMF